MHFSKELVVKQAFAQINKVPLFLTEVLSMQATHHLILYIKTFAYLPESFMFAHFGLTFSISWHKKQLNK